MQSLLDALAPGDAVLRIASFGGGGVVLELNGLCKSSRRALRGAHKPCACRLLLWEHLRAGQLHFRWGARAAFQLAVQGQRRVLRVPPEFSQLIPSSLWVEYLGATRLGTQFWVRGQ